MRLFFICLLVLSLGAVTGVGGLLAWQRYSPESAPTLPETSPTPTPVPPLLVYTFDALREQPVEPAVVTVGAEEIAGDDTYSVVPFTMTVLDRTMSGVVNLPADVSASTSAVVMLRGWVPANAYAPGVGTKNVAERLAKSGFVTIAPDFFGYGTSDPEPTDEWQARFEKPLVILSLLKALSETGLTLSDGSVFKPASTGIWGHSNGGQIALSSLAILQESVPTSIWAPVTAPFPYSILYYSDEEADEGQQTRKWIGIFDKTYDARAFSFTNYLDGLRGPLLLQQGGNDDATLKWWSDEFVQKLVTENERRADIVATSSAMVTPSGALTPITYDYLLYPASDHNMRPDWETAVQKDIEFFTRELTLSPAQ